MYVRLKLDFNFKFEINYDLIDIRDELILIIFFLSSQARV